MVNYPSFGVWFVGVDIPKELIKLLEVVDNSKWRQEQRWRIALVSNQHFLSFTPLIQSSHWKRSSK